MLTSFIACDDHIHIVTFLHYIDHFWELLRLMLKVIIHSYDELSLCVGKSAQKRRMLSKIPCHLDDLDTGIFFPEFLHNRKRPVPGPVIYKDQFKFFFYRFTEYFFQTGVQFLQRMF